MNERDKMLVQVECAIDDEGEEAALLFHERKGRETRKHASYCFTVLK